MANILRSGKIFPLGFHVGMGGNQTGLTENFLRLLDAAGIRFIVVSADAYPFDAAQIAKASGIKHTIIWRPTGIDTPINGYDENPITAADTHYSATMSVVPPELDKNIVYIGGLNEVDKNRADWLGWFCERWSENALADGYRPAMLGFSSGEPEYEHWLEPGMAAYLRLVSNNRDHALVMIHEYSYSVDDIYRWYPSLVGRYRLLMQACDALGIHRVPFAITEWGWEYQNVPPLPDGLQDMQDIAEEYVRLQENYGAAGWYLGGGEQFGNIANQFQPYIAPLGQIALNWEHYIDWQGTTPPPEPPTPVGDNMLKNGSFENGTYKWGGVDEFNIPDDWEWAFAPPTETNPIDGNPWSEFKPPEVVNPSAVNLPPHEQALFILDGERTLKIFKGGGAIKFRLTQSVTVTEPTTLRLTMPVYADLIKGYTNDGQKIWANDPQQRDGLYKFIVDGYSPQEWISLTPGAWNNIVAQRTVQNPGIVTVGVEIMLPFALQNNGIFADNWTLEAVAGDTEPPPEPPTDECIDTSANTRYHLLRPRNMSTAQWNFLHNKMTGGMQIPGIGHVIVGYEGWTHTDSMDAVKRAVAAGFSDSRLIVMDGDQIGTGLNSQWMADNCPLLLPYTLWIESVGGIPGPFEFKSWPVALPPYVTQYFGANPQNYNQFGLPGHDGVDMRAPEGTPILAAADGTVYRVDVNPSASNYGIHVRLLHQDGYKTIYGHFSRVADGIFLNKTVSAGDIIGYSGNTGNSFGAHLHLGLKREGFTFTDANGNVWPYNLFDPTPFLTKFCPACFPGAPPAPAGNARLGLHASADAGIASGEASMFATAKIEMVKILSNMPPEHCAALRDKTPGAPFVIRVYQDGWDRPGGISPSQFIDWNTTDVVRYMPLLDGRTVHIELHNEPNLVDEGLTHVWGNGREFSDWLMPVIADFRKTFPTKSLVFPGLSPGGDVAGIRYDSYRFVQEAAQAIALCNVLGVHVYWQKDLWPMNMALDQLDMYRRLFPDKPILITEASNNRASTSASVKGAEYIAFWRELQRRLEVLGVTYFVGSASNPSWGWSSGTGEVWLGSDVPVVVGNR